MGNIYSLALFSQLFMKSFQAYHFPAELINAVPWFSKVLLLFILSSGGMKFAATRLY